MRERYWEYTVILIHANAILKVIEEVAETKHAHKVDVVFCMHIKTMETTIHSINLSSCDDCNVLGLGNNSLRGVFLSPIPLLAWVAL